MKGNDREESVLIQYFGDSPFFKILDFLLENRLFDYSKTEIARKSGVGKVTLFKYWNKLEKFGIVKITREFGNTRLYKLNDSNPVIKKIEELEFVLADQALEDVKRKELVEA